MLLRRITKHVKDQNWFAVGIDFFIVVVGVFIGMQVANWNSASVSQRTEQALLFQLHEEIVKAELELNSPRVDPPGVDERIRLFVSAFFRDPADVPDEELCDVITGVNQLPYVIGTMSAVEELVSTGRLSQLKDKALRESITEYYELSKVGAARLPELREAAVNLELAFSGYITLSAFIDDVGEVRIDTECDVDAMRADPAFLNALARNVDTYDAWRSRIVVRPKAALAELRKNTERVLGIKPMTDSSS
ncbi:MAG: hypothetical protein AAF437_01330 [Pseudomonadota bacterium]